jgi:hypothetical protein
MKSAGVSPAVVQEFVGHDSKAVSQHYTHIELKALKKAGEALPTLFDRRRTQRWFALLYGLVRFGRSGRLSGVGTAEPNTPRPPQLEAPRLARGSGSNRPTSGF